MSTSLLESFLESIVYYVMSLVQVYFLNTVLVLMLMTLKMSKKIFPNKAKTNVALHTVTNV